MPFVYSPQPGSALPDIARGALPLTEWDLWIDSNEPVVMVLLHANTTNERVADARKIKSWLETSGRMTLTAQSTPPAKLFSNQ